MTRKNEIPIVTVIKFYSIYERMSSPSTVWDDSRNCGKLDIFSTQQTLKRHSGFMFVLLHEASGLSRDIFITFIFRKIKSFLFAFQKRLRDEHTHTQNMKPCLTFQ